MNQKNKIHAFSLACLAALLGSMSSAEAEAVSSNQDDIVMAAEATIDNRGRTHVVCSITNNSTYILSSAYPSSALDSYCFQFRLKDSKGNYQIMKYEWALAHAQKNEPLGVNGEHESKSSWIVTIIPSKKIEFSFDLEDAYGASAAFGRTLEIRWPNFFSHAGGTIEVGGQQRDGTIIPYHKEINHFPGKRSFSVSLPLPLPTSESKSQQKAQPSSALESSAAVETRVLEVPAVLSTQASTNPSMEPKFGSYWWLLLVITFIFLIWRSVRPRRPS